MNRFPKLNYPYPGLRDPVEEEAEEGAREEVHGHMEIESYRLLGPCSYEPTAMVSACLRLQKTQADKNPA